MLDYSERTKVMYEWVAHVVIRCLLTALKESRLFFLRRGTIRTYVITANISLNK